jgi:hypothetical protein
MAVSLVHLFSCRTSNYSHNHQIVTQTIKVCPIEVQINLSAVRQDILSNCFYLCHRQDDLRKLSSIHVPKEKVTFLYLDSCHNGFRGFLRKL